MLSYSALGSKEQTVLPAYQKPLALAPGCKVVLVDHHKAHAGSAYYTSGLNSERALVVTMDGIGDHASAGIWQGHANRLELIRSWGGEGSLGWFSSVTDSSSPTDPILSSSLSSNSTTTYFLPGSEF